MPHVIVKLWPGRSEEQKRALAAAMASDMEQITGAKQENISVSIEEVAPDQWETTVVKPEILGKPDNLYKKPE